MKENGKNKRMTIHVKDIRIEYVLYKEINHQLSIQLFLLVFDKVFIFFLQTKIKQHLVYFFTKKKYALKIWCHILRNVFDIK